MSKQKKPKGATKPKPAKKKEHTNAPGFRGYVPTLEQAWERGESVPCAKNEGTN